MKIFILILILVVAAGIIYLVTADKNGPPPVETNIAGYFQERLTTLAIEDIGQPIEGFDAELLIMAFPGLLPADFDNVQTLEGHYEVASNTIEFVRDQEQPISSAEKMVSSNGYATLLANLSERSNREFSSEVQIDALIAELNTAERLETKIDQGGNAFGVQVVPLEVREDSRCPIDVQCIQAGTVRLKTQMTIADDEPAEQEFRLGQTVTTAAAKITLINVLPAPESETDIPLTEYQFIFRIQKLPATSPNQ